MNSVTHRREKRVSRSRNNVGADLRVCPGLENTRLQGRHAGLPLRFRDLLGILILLLGTVAFSSTASAQPTRAPQSGPAQSDRAPALPDPAASGVLAESHKDYLISAGDVVEIQIGDAPELSRNYRVNARGSFEMEVIGRITAKGKTTEELARMIAGGLREQEYLKNPNVVVIIRQYNSQTFFIQGAVNRPGVYQVEGAPSLLMMIGLAGGLSDNHGSTAFIIRGVRGQRQKTDAQDSARQEQSNAQTAALDLSAQSQPRDDDAETSREFELLRINLGALYKGHFDQNQRLEPGDIVNIPRADVFFVAGEVQAPGSFPLKEGTTLRQAISLAQGTTFKAKPGAGLIFREDPESGKRQELKVDIGAVMGGKKEDIPILANDVIIVPNSRTKSVGGALLMALGVNSARIPIR
jgi:polysaccharide export outer membrane protein